MESSRWLMEVAKVDPNDKATMRLIFWFEVRAILDRFIFELEKNLIVQEHIARVLEILQNSRMGVNND